jgi:DNA (cytosine-5)-methyltransferase 1
VIAGGPPCQGFSQQRRGDNRDDRNDLVLEYARLVESISHRPSAVVLENVTYLDSPRGRRVMADYVARLSSLGYVVQRHDLNSADFGVPQLRRRIVLVALAPEVAPHYGGPVPLTADRFVTIGEALAGLPTGADPTIPNHVSANESAINTRRIAYVDMGRGRLAIPESLQLQCHRGYDGHLDVYGRLNWLGQARTITGGFDSASRGEYAHPFRNRSITAREAARIQGFPDWFSFEGNRAAVRRQIGNAVPPPLGYAIGRAVLDAITVASHGTAPL